MTLLTLHERIRALKPVVSGTTYSDWLRAAAYHLFSACQYSHIPQQTEHLVQADSWISAIESGQSVDLLQAA